MTNSEYKGFADNAIENLRSLSRRFPEGALVDLERFSMYLTGQTINRIRADLLAWDTDQSRTWVCPGCGRTLEHSYEALAEVGNPICPRCDLGCDLVGRVQQQPDADEEARPRGILVIGVRQGPACTQCGSIMSRNGGCHICFNCGTTSGCS